MMARGSLCRRAFDSDYGQILVVSAPVCSEDVSDYISHRPDFPCPPRSLCVSGRWPLGGCGWTGSVQRIAEQLGIAWVESVDLVDDFGC